MHCKTARSIEWSQWTARLKQVTQALEDFELSYWVDEVVGDWKSLNALLPDVSTGITVTARSLLTCLGHVEQTIKSELL